MFDTFGGFFTCAATNLHHHTVEVNFKAVDEEGDSLLEETLELRPEESRNIAIQLSTGFAIRRCVFQFRGKKNRIRAAATASQGFPDNLAKMVVVAE